VDHLPEVAAFGAEALVVAPGAFVS
jgi:hypothetical protein